MFNLGWVIQMTLHEAIIQVLTEEGRALDLEEIAAIINRKKLYVRKWS